MHSTGAERTALLCSHPHPGQGYTVPGLTVHLLKAHPGAREDDSPFSIRTAQSLSCWAVALGPNVPSWDNRSGLQRCKFPTPGGSPGVVHQEISSECGHAGPQPPACLQVHSNSAAQPSLSGRFRSTRTQKNWETRSAAGTGAGIARDLARDRRVGPDRVQKRAGEPRKHLPLPPRRSG